MPVYRPHSPRGAPMPDLGSLSCSVCFHSFDTAQHKPFDLGCGHCFCESCLREHPRSFAKCPECRARASNPHVSITLLRLLDSAGGTPSGSSAARHQQSQQPRQQQPAQQRRNPPPQPATAAAVPPSGINLAEHQRKINELRTSMWSWISPLMGILYILSPLDLIPDILPIIGWMDDAVVLLYVVFVVCGMLNRRHRNS